MARITKNEQNWKRKDYETWDEAFRGLAPAVRQQSVRVAAYTQALFIQACAGSFGANTKDGEEQIQGQYADLAYKCGMYHQLGKARFNEYGVPKNKSKTAKKASDKKETVPNANYLWISYFATALNENGRAGLVMANSASDAGNSEYDIRKKMIEAGIIKQMVSLPSNMFSSVTLPATLWFFDKSKVYTDKRDEILFIDARNVFTQVDRAHRKFSEEQIKNLAVITRLYEGDTQTFENLVNEYEAKLAEAPETSDDKDIMPKSYWQSQLDWLLERFPDGKYRDVIGLCKVAKLEGEDGIIDQDYSLNPGRYVGVVIEDDDMTKEEFKLEVLSLNDELSNLNKEAHYLEQLISKNLLELF